MKKSFLMLGLAVAAMTSCTNDEVVEVNQSNLIKFESFVNKGTRAVTEVSSLTSFYVFGGYNGNNVFDNVSATNGDTQKNWVLNQTYDFAAYADGNGGHIASSGSDVATVSFADDKLTITGYTVSDAKDLIAAVTPNVASGNNGQPVNLTFRHLLSQVSFQFFNTSDYYMEVTDITFAANKKGDCEVGSTVNAQSTTWKNWSNLQTYTYEGTENYLAPQNGSTYAEYKPDFQMVIPQNLSEVKADFNVNFYQKIGDTYVIVDSYTYEDVVLTGTGANNDGDDITKWMPSYRYNYVAYFPANPSTIKFSATVDIWKDDQVDDNTTNNPSITF